MIDDTEDARDYLDEAERIVAGKSCLLPERAHLDALASALSDARFALQRITKREGRFSLSPLTHASNTVDDMAEIAQIALAATRGREMGNGTSAVSENEH